MLRGEGLLLQEQVQLPQILDTSDEELFVQASAAEKLKKLKR